MSRSYIPADEDRLQSVQQEYQELADAVVARYTLCSAFNHPGFRITDYCRDFTANPVAAAGEDVVKTWAQRFDLWIPGVTEHCNDLASCLYPGASLNRLVTIGKNFAIDWYLNDTIGRDKIANLARADQNTAKQLRSRIIHTSTTLTEQPHAAPIEHACLDMLTAVRSTSTSAWFRLFRRLWIGNLQTMCQDGNARSHGVVATVPEYIHTRTYISGMQHTIALGEFAQNQYLDWPKLQRQGLAKPLARLWWLCAVIGCISNDLFSFEKEFIRHYSDSNIVLVTILNNPDLTLHEAITTTITYIRNQVIEFITLTRSLASQGDIPGQTPTPLSAFIRFTQWCLKATWVWQNLSQRYKSPHSIFHETRT